MAILGCDWKSNMIKQHEKKRTVLRRNRCGTTCMQIAHQFAAEE